MVLYTPGPYHGIPPPPGYTSTGVGVSGGPEGVGAYENTKPLINLGQFFAPGEMFNCPGFKLTLVIKKPQIHSPTMPEIGIGVSVSPWWHAIMGWYPMV